MAQLNVLLADDDEVTTLVPVMMPDGSIRFEPKLTDEERMALQAFNAVPSFAERMNAKTGRPHLFDEPDLNSKEWLS